MRVRKKSEFSLSEIGYTPLIIDRHLCSETNFAKSDKRVINEIVTVMMMMMMFSAGGEGNNRRRLNTQVTVAVEPPSPTDGSPTTDFAGRHQRSQFWKEEPDESRRDLHRTKTMPARRSRSSTDVADSPDAADHGRHRRRYSPAADGEDQARRPSKNAPPPPELLNPAALEEDDIDENDDDGAAQRSSCRVYRVRSFTTKKVSTANP